MVFKAVHSLIRFIRPGESPQIEGMTFSRLRSRQDYLKFREQQGREIDQQMAELEAAAPAGRVPFTIPGFSFTAGRDVDFLVDYKHAGNGPINWRESVNRPVTYFNNRMRASFHIFDLEIPLRRKADLYLTEEVTPIFAYFKNKFPNAVGSEYMGTAIPLGAKNENGVRNEDLTALTFADSSFDALVSLDVLEHVPDTMKGLSECRRVLRKGGRAMISAPFVAANAQNSLRAVIENGEIRHLLPPEYHGDPMSSAGILCFHHFGWELLTQMRSAGFKDAYAVCYFSRKFGYVGGEQFIFIAVV